MQGKFDFISLNRKQCGMQNAVWHCAQWDTRAMWELSKQTISSKCSFGNDGRLIYCWKNIKITLKKHLQMQRHVLYIYQAFWMQHEIYSLSTWFHPILGDMSPMLTDSTNKAAPPSSFVHLFIVLLVPFMHVYLISLSKQTLQLPASSFKWYQHILSVTSQKFRLVVYAIVNKTRCLFFTFWIHFTTTMATDQEMMDRIAKLSSAIEQQKHMASNRGGYYGRGRPFRGRGGNMSLSTRHPAAPYYPANNKYINPATVKARPAALTKANHQPHSFAVSTPTSSMSTASPLPLPPQSRNKKLVINHKGSNTTTSNTMVKSVDPATGRKQVAIDGVDFVVKGKKLIRKDLFDSNMTKTNLMMANSTAPKVLVRKSIKR